MVHFASIRHPATILDDLHGKVLNEAYQISKSTVTDSVSTEVQRQEHFSHVRAVESLCRELQSAIFNHICRCSILHCASFLQCHWRTYPSLYPIDIHIVKSCIVCLLFFFALALNGP